jgi:hypothetical protein
MRFRIVVPSIEAWLMADREHFASFLALRVGALSMHPEELPDCKSALLSVVHRETQRSEIKKALLPDPRSGRREGPEYAMRLIEFIDKVWDPQRAAKRAPGLARTLLRLGTLTTQRAQT